MKGQVSSLRSCCVCGLGEGRSYLELLNWSAWCGIFAVNKRERMRFCVRV